MSASSFSGSDRPQSSQPAKPERFDKLPPQNLDAEKSVLGSILLNNEALEEVSDFLVADHFYLDAHQRIYKAILLLRDKGVSSFDAVTVMETLEKTDEFKDIGGETYLTDLLASVPHAAHVKYHAQIVYNKAVQRRLIAACTDVLRDCYDPGQDIDEVLGRAEQSVFSIVEQQEASQKIELRDILLDTFDRINQRMEHAGEINGLTTGFTDLDIKTNGLQKTELLILAARPSMGKTAFVCNLAEAAADKGKAGVIIFSLEQSKLELAERLLCIRAGLQVHKMRKGDFTEEERDTLLRVSQELSEIPMFIDDQPGRNMPQVAAICRRLKRKHNLGLVIIDYLQLIEPEDKRLPREQQIASITRRLKFLAKELDVPVMALAQLNRGVELREDKRPKLADLRESGAIEQDADIVMFLHRPEMYDPEDRPGEAEIIVAKNRSGPTGIVNLAFSKESMRFHDFSPMNEPEGGYFASTEF